LFPTESSLNFRFVVLSLVTTEIAAPNSEETPVVQILNPNNSDNDVQLVEPLLGAAISVVTKDDVD
jgi:hypothetical protein